MGIRLAQAFGVVLAVITAEESSAVACRHLNDLGISGTFVKRAIAAPAAPALRGSTGLGESEPSPIRRTMMQRSDDRTCTRARRMGPTATFIAECKSRVAEVRYRRHSTCSIR